MKKSLTILSLPLVMVSVFLLVGCSNARIERHPNSVSTITTDIEIEIRRVFAIQQNPHMKHTANDLFVTHYYGTFDGATIFDMACVCCVPDVLLRHGVIAGYKFIFKATEPWVFYDGHIRLLNHAYGVGVLTRESVSMLWHDMNS